MKSWNANFLKVCWWIPEGKFLVLQVISLEYVISKMMRCYQHATLMHIKILLIWAVSSCLSWYKYRYCHNTVSYFHVYQTKLLVTKIIGTNKDTCQHLQLYICTYVCINTRYIYIHTSIMMRSIRSHTSLHWVTLLIARTNSSFYNTNTFLQLTFFCFWRFINWPLLVNILFQFWKWFERTWPQRHLHLGGLVSIKN